MAERRVTSKEQLVAERRAAALHLLVGLMRQLGVRRYRAGTIEIELEDPPAPAPAGGAPPDEDLDWGDPEPPRLKRDLDQDG